MIILIKKLFENDKIRYLFAGGCTTLVNFIVFFSLRLLTHINRNTCNVIAIIMAIIFAYFINKIFVFQSKTEGTLNMIREAVSFGAARLFSMGIEVLSFAVLCDSFRLNEIISKVIVQVIIVVVNYVFSVLFVFNKKHRDIKERLKETYCYWVSFLIVAVVMLAIFIAEKITPFGTNSLTIVDSLHQYLPFFSDYRDKILNEGSLFYTWNIAMGSNFVSLFSYYLASPLNFLLLLFSKEYIAAGVCIIMALKICLSAVTMAYFLVHRNGKQEKNVLVIAISCCYALSNYVIGYSWNVMWMDCILIFPLIILGFSRLMENGRSPLYALTLCYCLYCNYYIGYIVCLFLVLWFFAYNHGGVKKFFINGIRFAFHSLLAGGMAAFLLLPAYFGIMQTASAGAKIPKWEWYGSIFAMMKQQLFLTEPITNQTFDGGVNLYCGMLAIFGFFVFLTSWKIKFSEKIRYTLLLAVLMVSFNSKLLNFIWHGMHDQYGIPNRFSFLYIFVLLVAAYEGLKRVRKMHITQVLAITMFSISYVLLCNIKMSEGLDKKVMIGSLCLIAAYAIICGLGSLNILKKKAFNITLSALCIVEIMASGIIGFLENGYSNLEPYYKTTPNVTAANEYIQDRARKQVAGFYRSELVDSTVLDEATWHNMPSVGTFCSTVLGEMTTTMGRLGFYTGANEFLYMGSTPFTNSIFNIRYLLEREGNYNNFDFDYVATVENVGIFENPYPLSLGFCVNHSVKEWNRDEGLPLECQANLAKHMCDRGDFFFPVRPELIVDSSTCDISVNGTSVDYTPNEKGDHSIMVSFYVPESGDYYLNCRGNSINKIKFFIDGEEKTFDRYQIQIFHLGEVAAGQYITIEYVYKNIEAKPAVLHLTMSMFDVASYWETYMALSKDCMQVDKYDDGYIAGYVNMPDGKTLFTSIPYDKGWKLKVDGKEAEYYAIGKSFIGIDMTPGEHNIELTYTPVGLKEGIIISVVSWIILVLVVMNNSNKKRHGKLVINNKNEIDLSDNI